MTKAKLPPGFAHKALCHPSKPHAGQGLCQACLERANAGEAMTKTTGARIARARRTEILELHKSSEYVESLALQAKAILRERLPEYAELHWQAAQAAAEKGDARPTEWALSQVKTEKGPVVDPPAKTPESGGVKVFVGIQMGGVPSAGLPAVTVDAQSMPETPNLVGDV